MTQPFLSANGLVEYNSHTFCGEMYGSLVTVMFAATDNIVGYAKQGGVVSADGGSKNCKTRGCRKLFEPGAPQAAKFLDPLQVSFVADGGSAPTCVCPGEEKARAGMVVPDPTLTRDLQIALESPESGTLVVAEFLGNTNQAGALTTAIPYLAKDPQVTTATTVVAALPVPLDGAAAAVVGNTIFVFGGAGSNAIWEYQPGTNKYTSAGTVPGWPAAGVFGAAAAVRRLLDSDGEAGAEIFLCGGAGGGARIGGKCFVLDGDDPGSAAKSSAPIALPGPPLAERGFATLHGQRYGLLVGGFKPANGAASSAVVLLDLAAKAVVDHPSGGPVAQLPQPLRGANVAAIGDHVYVWGGGSGPGKDARATLRYDFALNAWVDYLPGSPDVNLPPLPAGAGARSASVNAMQGRLHHCNGANTGGGEPLPTACYRLDVTAKKPEWVKLAATEPRQVQRAAVATWRGSAYAFGGAGPGGAALAATAVHSYCLGPLGATCCAAG